MIPKFKEGDWIRSLNHGFYRKVMKVLDDNKIVLRDPGAYREDGYVCTTSIVEINNEIATLLPDFSNARINDKAFSFRKGEVKIETVLKKEGRVKACGITYDFNGRESYLDKDKHPTLFHSYAQAKAYFDEIYLMHLYYR